MLQFLLKSIAKFVSDNQLSVPLTEGLVFETHFTMTTQTRIQLKLQRESGSIFYQDKDDNLAFHIEALRSTSSSPSPDSKGTLSDQASQSSTAATSESEHQAGRIASPDHEEESAAMTGLIKSFLRQHLLRNGGQSRCLIPLMRKDGIEALLIATVVLHLQKDGGGEGEDDSLRDDGAAIRSLHKTLGSLVSVMQQRESVLKYLDENPPVVSEDDVEAEGEQE